MSSKSRRSISSCITCTVCQSTLMQKDVEQHQNNCPPDPGVLNYNYINDGILHGNIEVYAAQEQPKNIPERELHDLVFVSQMALQLLEIAIGDPVLISSKSCTIVKTAWPTVEKTMLSISLTKYALELNGIQGVVTAKKVPENIKIAKEFVIVPIGKHALQKPVSELDILLKNCNEQKLFCIDNKISVPFYGKKLTYKIKEAVSGRDTDNNLSDELKELSLAEIPKKQLVIYKALYSTKWTIREEPQIEVKSKCKNKSKIEELGGYDDLITDIKDIINIGLGKFPSIGDFYISKGILLYGTPGVGKSMIANSLISQCEAHTVIIYSSDIYCKSLGDTEQKLKDLFDEAKAKAPSIILIEDIDTLCPRRSNSSTDHERRVLSQLVTLFDDLQNMSQSVVLLATTSKLDYVDASLRRPGRIDKEIEVNVPTPDMRTEILKKLLLKIPNSLMGEDVENMSSVTHGFVGADLYGLCSQAVVNAIKRQQQTKGVCEKPSEVTAEDFRKALTVTKPSAMKEVLIEVPNVHWSDIGGQHDLKLKLKQAVEWPLRHPEAFMRMGITPPRGVLMFGPPGCSKTMIAKALATESKVNFLNIKGPELFSKWVGESEKAVREVFRKARQVAPSIVFIDEIDALGVERGSLSSNGGSNVQERVLAQLLTELDGVTALGNVTLVAATNRPDKIDKALLRPGRLDRIIYVRLPDYETRQEIFHIKLKNMPIATDVIVQDLVELTEGYTGAEIQAICHEAAMKALEENIDANIVTKEHFKAALSVVTPRTPAYLMNLYDNYINKIF